MRERSLVAVVIRPDLFPLVLGIGLFALASACGVGSVGIVASASADGDEADAPFSVLNQLPSPGASDVDRTAPVRVNFSAAVEASSLSPATFSLRDPSGSPVDGFLSIVGPQVEFLPTVALEFSTTYALVLSPQIRDTAGRGALVPPPWTFTTGAGRWTDPETITTFAAPLDLTLDERGNATAIVTANSFDPIAMSTVPILGGLRRPLRSTQQWGIPVALLGGYVAESAALAEPSSGPVPLLAVKGGMQAGSFDPEMGWLEFTRLGNSANSPPSLTARSTSSSVSAIGAWRNAGGRQDPVQAAVFDLARGWTDVASIAPPSNDVQNIVPALADNGMGFVLWEDGNAIRANSYRPSQGWQPPSKASLADLVDERIEALSIDARATGALAAILSVPGGGGAGGGPRDLLIRALRYEADTDSWTPVEPVYEELGTMLAGAPYQVRASIASGVPCVFWSTERRAYFSCFQGQAWGAPRILERFDFVQLAFDINSTSTAVLAWSESTLPGVLHVSLATPATGWSEPRVVYEDMDGRSVGNVRLDLNDRGEVVLAWSADDPSGATIFSFASRFE